MPFQKLFRTSSRSLGRVLCSQAGEEARFKAAALKRTFSGKRRAATFFHAVDDPMSLLVAESLRQWFPFDAVSLDVRIVCERPQDFFPHPELFLESLRRDAAELSCLFHVEFPDVCVAPDEDATQTVRHYLLARQEEPGVLGEICELGTDLFSGAHGRPSQLDGSPAGDTETLARRAEQNEQARRRARHFASGLVCFEGGTYLGVDRLQRLRRRLGHELNRDLGKVGVGVPAESLQGPAGVGAGGPALQLFFSLRSPYSYLAYDRALRLCDHYGVKCVLRPVLPMRMRGTPVPKLKGLRFLLDCAEEARALGIAFGNIADPLGAGVERAYAVWPYAKRLGLERQWFSCAFRAAWADGVDLSTEAGLLGVARKVGGALSGSVVQQALRDDSWRTLVDENMREQVALGFWGVPSFVYGDAKSWGQDRLVLAERAILRRANVSSAESRS